LVSGSRASYHLDAAAAGDDRHIGETEK
jgi:hypothetical protein